MFVEPTLSVVGDPGFSPSTVIAFLGSGAVGVTVSELVLHGSEPENIPISCRNRTSLKCLEAQILKKIYLYQKID